MAISYQIYANNGQGGEVDYSSPIATTTNLSITVGALAAPSDNTFGIRALDVTSGIEEANTNARVRVVIDPAGNDITSRPNAVNGLSVHPTAGGTCRLVWGYDTTGQGGAPTRFVVFLTPGPTSPVLTINYQPGVSGYGASLTGLANHTNYSIAVQAIGASEPLASVESRVRLDYRVPRLSNVDSLVAVSSP